MKKNQYCCTSFRKYDFLTHRGFEVKNIRKNFYDANKSVWFFDDTPELREAVNYYYEHYHEVSDELTVNWHTKTFDKI